MDETPKSASSSATLPLIERVGVIEYRVMTSETVVNDELVTLRRRLDRIEECLGLEPLRGLPGATTRPQAEWENQATKDPRQGSRGYRS